MVDIAENQKSAVETRVAEEEKYAIRPAPAGPGSLDSQFIRDCLDCNELGDGLLFKTINAGKFAFNKSRAEWMVWRVHHWEIDMMGEAAAAVERVVEVYAQERDRVVHEIKEQPPNSPNAEWLHGLRDRLGDRMRRLRERRRANCLEYAHTCDRPMAVHGQEVDTNPWLLPCKNCVIDLRSGAVRDGRPDDYLLKASPIEWLGYDAPRDRWVDCLMQIHEGDALLVEFLQRLYGMAIIGTVVEKVMPVLIGPGGNNGKTTELEALLYVLGPLAGPIPPEMLIETNRPSSSSGPSPDIMSLKGLRVAIASETRAGSKFSEAQCKRFTGNDTLQGRWPHDKMPVNFEPTHTLFMMTNFAPHFDVEDRAFMDRLVNVPFNLSFLRNRKPVGDNERRAEPHLKEHLREQAPGILAWLVDGCLLYQKHGLMIPPSVVKANEAYRESEDTIGQFVEFCLVRGPVSELEIGATEIYELFAEWWSTFVSKKGNPPAQKKFGAYMRARFDHSKVGGLFRYYGAGINDDVIRELKIGKYRPVKEK